VTHTGAIRAGHADWAFITSALMGKTIGLEPLGNRIYRIYFRQYFLGYLDEAALKAYDIMHYEYDYKV
jgi:hypothetical protein